MEVLKENHEKKNVFNLSDMNTVFKNGVRDGDLIELQAFQEKRRELIINRVSYNFELGEESKSDHMKCFYMLPAYNQTFSTFLLEQKELSFIVDGKVVTKFRYLLSSKGNTPFCLNGNYVFSAFCERGDIVEFGYNKIIFKKSNQVSSSLDAVVDDGLLTREIIESSLNVLIEGETGTGKTRLARMIHEKSKRSGAFIHLNLASFAPGLIESEIFGHMKGAFTGALVSKKGALLEAHKGTLFLDEIDSLSLDIQQKLLLFLDNFEFRSVGGEASKKVDVRIIVASGKILSELVKTGEIRRDFYYRIASGAKIKMKSLRQNKEQIKSICQQFSHEHSVVITEPLIKFYCGCQWPGNIRQLISHLLKKKVLAAGKKLVLDESDYELLKTEDIDEAENDFVTLEQLKKDYCYRVFLKLNQNISVTSKVLEISPNTLKAILKSRKELRDNNVINVNF